MLLETLGCTALLSSVTGSTLVFLRDEYSKYAFLLWIYSNITFIYLLIVGFEVVQGLYFIAFSVMAYTALYGLFVKLDVIKLGGT